MLNSFEANARALPKNKFYNFCWGLDLPLKFESPKFTTDTRVTFFETEITHSDSEKALTFRTARFTRKLSDKARELHH